MKRTALVFTAPEQVEVREEEISQPGPGQVLVRANQSAISPGTEMLIYSGRVPRNLALDESIASLGGTFDFPFKYGYACVGEVLSLGEGVDRSWEGKHVFSFHPHESAFLAAPSELMEIPPGVPVKDAVFLPNMETAVNFVMDGCPLIGESVAVFGLGIVGLLTTALLARLPLSALVTLDRYEKRRVEALRLGVTAALDPAADGAVERALKLLQPEGLAAGGDLAFEISGSPQALEMAIHLTGFDGRIVIGSWYGSKPVSLDLGGRFHRSRIQLIGSQVSTVDPALSGRWSKSRRMQVAWNSLREICPSRWITHRFPIGEAEKAYRLLAERPEEAIQVILEY